MQAVTSQKRLPRAETCCSIHDNGKGFLQQAHGWSSTLPGWGVARRGGGDAEAGNRPRAITACAQENDGHIQPW
jgi:hypothetical protein